MILNSDFDRGDFQISCCQGWGLPGGEVAGVGWLVKKTASMTSSPYDLEDFFPNTSEIMANFLFLVDMGKTH